MTKRRAVFLVAGVVAVSCVVVVAFTRQQDDPDNTSAASAQRKIESSRRSEALGNNVVGLSAVVPDGVRTRSLSAADTKAGQLWELSSVVPHSGSFLVNAYYEQGRSLRRLSGYAKLPLREAIVSNINVQISNQYPSYKQLVQRDLTLQGLQANETVFEYTSQGARITQRLLILIKNADTAVYVRGQARSPDYATVNEKFFEPIFSSLSFK